MSKQLVRRVCTALILTGALVLSPMARAAELHAGAAQTDITPPLGFPMWGYGARHDAASQGVLDPLRARAVVLKVDAEHIALVSLDLGRAPPRESFERIAKQLKEKKGPTHLFLVASHTHHGPVLEMDSWPTPKNSYISQLEKKLVDVILAANDTLTPARIGFAAAQTKLNRNRHSKRSDPPVDGELIVARIEDMQGKPIAHLVNFAAHPTMHPAKVLKFSADYPGAMASLVEKDSAAPCLFLQGASGDLSTNAKGQGPDAFGQTLGKEVLALAKQTKCDIGKDTTLKVKQRQFVFKSRIDLGNPVVHAAYTLAFFKELVNFYEREYREGIRPKLVTALIDGRIGLVGVSGEFFCGHALSLKKRARLDHLLFLGYCNDYQQYFPTIEAVAEGGYGADATVAPVEVGAGEQMMNHALIDLYQMRGKIAAPK